MSGILVKVLFLPDFVFCVYLHMKEDGNQTMLRHGFHLQVSKALPLQIRLQCLG